jgi:hypothetical protein
LFLRCFRSDASTFPTPAGDPPLPAEELVPKGSPDHHAPTQIQTLAHRGAAAGGHQINGTISVTNPDTVVLGLGIATLASDGGNTIPSTADVNGIRIGGLRFDAGTTNSAQLPLDQRRQLRHRVPGLRPRRLLLLQHELGCGQRERPHVADLVRGAVA